MPDKDRLEVLKGAKEAWLEIHALVIKRLLPALELHVSALEELKIKTACKVNHSSDLHKGVVVAGALYQAASAGLECMRGAYALFNQCHQLDVFIRNTENGDTMEDITVKLRGMLGDSVANPLLATEEVRIREMLTEASQKCTDLRAKSGRALHTARNMTLNDLDKYREWVAKEYPELLELAEGTDQSPINFLVPEAEA